MIVNLDDIKYELMHSSMLFKKIKKYKTIDLLLKDQDAGWLLCMFSRRTLVSRLLEAENYATASDALYFMDHFEQSAGWTEKEEMIRTNNYWKHFYEKKTGKKI